MSSEKTHRVLTTPLYTEEETNCLIDHIDYTEDISAVYAWTFPCSCQIIFKQG